LFTTIEGLLLLSSWCELKGKTSDKAILTALLMYIWTLLCCNLSHSTWYCNLNLICYAHWVKV